MKSLGTLDWVAICLVIIGGLNWGLVGFFDYNLVSALFSRAPVIENIIYAAVGIASLYMIFLVSRKK